MVPEAMLGESEARELATALVAVNEHYATAIDPKKLAWFALLGVAGKIYGARAMAFMVRHKAEAMAKARVSPLAGTSVRPVAPTPNPTARQTVPASAVPQNIRQMFADPTTIPDMDAGE
jgi:hypothetical protein